jgi:S-DNA-T family DNA segregation ATPase FtsK/SpoIIIE
MDLLEPPAAGDGENEQSLQKRARTLEKTLAEFNIDGRVVHIECGPRVTLYEISLAPGIKLSRVMNLADNISMALKAHNVRIIAPIPGRDTVGIEIPNIEKDLVTLGEVIETVDRKKRRETLPICLAKDVSGRALVADLTKMPHLLIAGATGSGKSVCINSVILSFLMCCRPDEVKLILIDPKVVELSRFKKIPHLLCPVITDMKRAVNVLEWACQQMDERYEQLSMVGVNNVQKFNALGEAEIEKRLTGMYAPEELDLFPKQLPYIVMIIDELADLMLVAKKEVETQITRLAAKSRAVGIHVIFATQRPSVDVITGLIKANMPCRIAFQVASRVDSRTILDQNGAETLLGAGDMLYLPPGVGKLTRAQGVYVSDDEMQAVVDFCHEQEPPEFHEDLEGPVVGGARAGGDTPSDADELFHEAAFAILESGRGSVSLLQRRLGVGYGRAARIIDQLAEAGLLGPFREGKPRDILLTSEEFVHMYGDGSRQGSLLFGGSAAAPRAGLREDESEPGDAPWEEDEETATFADEEDGDDETEDGDEEEYEYDEADTGEEWECDEEEEEEEED